MYECVAAWVPKVRKQGTKAGAGLLEDLRDQIRRELIRTGRDGFLRNRNKLPTRDLPCSFREAQDDRLNLIEPPAHSGIR